MENFTFKGISSTTMGVVMSDEWIATKATRRYETTEIDGMDGAIITPKGYSLVEKNVECTLLNRKRLNDVVAWLDGSGVLELGGRYRNAQIYGEINYANLGANRNTFTIPFILEPFWYRDEGYMLYATSQEDGVCVNEGNVESKPIVKIVGTGVSTISINGLVFSISLGDSENDIVIDSKKKTEDKPKNITIGFDYPTLMPGENDIKVLRGDANVYIKRKDRWIG